MLFLYQVRAMAAVKALCCLPLGNGATDTSCTKRPILVRRTLVIGADPLTDPLTGRRTQNVRYERSMLWGPCPAVEALSAILYHWSCPAWRSRPQNLYEVRVWADGSARRNPGVEKENQKRRTLTMMMDISSRASCRSIARL